MTDDAFLIRFERCEFSREEWRHREHLKAAYLYLLRFPFAEALDRMRAGVQALNARHKVPEAIDRGYHETLTCCWMRLVHCALCEAGPAASADAFLDQHTQLLAKRAALFFYSRDRILSADAKARWVEPDLAPLPRSTRSHLPGSKTSP